MKMNDIVFDRVMRVIVSVFTLSLWVLIINLVGSTL